MNRRNFLALSGASVVALALGIGAYTHFKTAESPLATDLKPFFNMSFKEAAQKADAGNLFANLRAKGVIDEHGKINISVLDSLAKTDNAIPYQGLYYSQTELELYSFAYLMHENKLVRLKEHDLLGGDYHSMKVKDADECFAACESSSQCTGFTYAEPTHPIEEKHNSCWLKDKPVKYNVSDHYISGTK